MKTFAELLNLLREFTVVKQDGLLYVVPSSMPNLVKTWHQQGEKNCK